jgi:hypothetical protein
LKFFLTSQDGGPFIDPENNFSNITIRNASTSDWDHSFDNDILHIEVINDILDSWYLEITPKPGQNGKVNITLYAEDEHSSIELTTTVEVLPINDPPIFRSIIINENEFPVDFGPDGFFIDISEDFTILEDDEYEIEIVTEDPDTDISRIGYNKERSRSDDWNGTFTVDGRSGKIILIPNNEDVISQNSKLVISANDGDQGGKVYLEIVVEITNTNDDPEIEIPFDFSPIFYQFDEITVIPVFSDIDPGEKLTLDVNMDHKIGDFESLNDILPEADLKSGYDWIFSPVTGELIFNLDNQNIWKQRDTMKDRVIITLALMVTDSGGGSDVATIQLTLVDVNEPPLLPDMFDYNIIDEDPDEPGLQGLTVEFMAVETTDPDMDELLYSWDFGDGQTVLGRNVNHTYTDGGSKTVKLTVSDDEFATEPRTAVISLVEPNPAPQSSPDDGSDDDSNIFLYIVGGLILIFLMVIIAMFILLIRKPQIKEEGKEE